MKILVTGGAGFIGSNFVRLVLRERPDWSLVDLDLLTYAGNLENLADVVDDPRHRFVRGDICDGAMVRREIAGVDAVVNFAAESHVDRALYEPGRFVQTNVVGTWTLLDAAREARVPRFVQVSTDEVYGSAPDGVAYDEEGPLKPSSAYSAAKAGADLLALAYVTTFHLPVVVTRSSNNYGPYQHPEKFIPLFACNALDGRPCPLYGDGRNERDWVHVEDNVRGILLALEKGRSGAVYHFASGKGAANIDIARRIVALSGRDASLIRLVTDRPGHDRRYAITAERARTELGWAPAVDFDAGLKQTVEWYRANRAWVDRVRSGEYQTYYERHYGSRVS